MDYETLRALAMQRVQHLILNPESRSMTLFPMAAAAMSNVNSSAAVVSQPWLHASNVNCTADSGTGHFEHIPDMFPAFSTVQMTRFS